MSINLSLGDLFERVFGYRTEAFNPKFAQKPAKKQLGTHQAPYYAVSPSGQEYYLPIHIEVGHDKIPGTDMTYAEYLGVTNRDGSYIGQWSLPFPVLSVTSTKTIIDTPMTERQGLVSELINISGYRYNVKGLLIGDNDDFPEADFAILNRLYEINKPIRITNVITDMQLVKTERAASLEVVIRDISWPGEAGVPGVRGYNLTMTSNEPFNLIDIS